MFLLTAAVPSWILAVISCERHEDLACSGPSAESARGSKERRPIQAGPLMCKFRLL